MSGYHFTTLPATFAHRTFCLPVNRIKWLVIALFSCLPISSRAQYDSLFALPRPAQYAAFNRFIGAGTDSVKDMKTVNSLLAAATAHGDEFTILNARRAVLAIHQLWNCDTGQLFSDVKQLINDATTAGCQPVVTFCYITLGDCYYNNRQFALAFEYYLRAYDQYSTNHPEDYPDMSATQFSLAKAFYRFGDYPNALRYSSNTIKATDTNSIWLKILFLDLAGSSCQKLGKYDSANRYFDSILPLAPIYHTAEGRIAWHGIAIGKKGVSFFLQKNYSAAEPLLQTGLTLCDSAASYNNISDFALKLGKIRLEEGDISETKKLLSHAYAALQISPTIQELYSYYTLAASYYRHIPAPATALSYMDSALVINDSIEQLLNVQNKHLAELQVAQEQFRYRELQAASERQKQIFIRNILILLTIVAAIILLIIYNRKLLKQKLLQKQVDTARRLAEQELQSAEQQLTIFRNNIDEKNNIIASLEQNLSQADNTEAIALLHKSTILTDAQWEDFKSLFETVHPGFQSALRNRLPGLSPAETRFMLLAKLGFSNKEMAGALGVSTQAVRTTWYRIRKKLNLPEEGNVEELLEMI